MLDEEADMLDEETIDNTEANIKKNVKAYWHLKDYPKPDARQEQARLDQPAAQKRTYPGVKKRGILKPKLTDVARQKRTLDWYDEDRNKLLLPEQKILEHSCRIERWQQSPLHLTPTWMTRTKFSQRKRQQIVQYIHGQVDNATHCEQTIRLQWRDHNVQVCEFLLKCLGAKQVEDLKKQVADLECITAKMRAECKDCGLSEAEIEYWIQFRDKINAMYHKIVK